MNRYWRDRVAPVRIGGRDGDGRQRIACSLEALGECSLDHLSETPVPTAVQAYADWGRIADVCCFNRMERYVWFYQWQHGLEASLLMGLTPHQVGAATRGIELKLRDNLPALRGLMGWEREIFEKKVLVTTPKPIFLGLSLESYMKNSIELNEKLVAEKLKLGRLQGRVQAAEAAVRQAEDNLDEIEQGLKASRVQAALDEKEWPDEAALRQLAPARAALTEAKAARDAARQAGVKQEAIVSGILAEIHACRLEAFAAEIAPHKVRYNTLLTELLEEAREINALAGDARYSLSTYELSAAFFPYALNQADSMSRALESRDRCLAFNAVLGLSRWER